MDGAEGADGAEDAGLTGQNVASEPMTPARPASTGKSKQRPPFGRVQSTGTSGTPTQQHAQHTRGGGGRDEGSDEWERESEIESLRAQLKDAKVGGRALRHTTAATSATTATTAATRLTRPLRPPRTTLLP